MRTAISLCGMLLVCLPLHTTAHLTLGHPPSPLLHLPPLSGGVMQDQGCLPGLVLFLDDRDEKVVLTSLQALSYLAEEPTNCPMMKSEIGLTESLKIISKKCVRLVPCCVLECVLCGQCTQLCCCLTAGRSCARKQETWPVMSLRS